MKTRTTFASLSALGLAAALFAFAGSTQTAANADDKAPAASASAVDASGQFTIDAVHSSVLFRIKHMNAAYFYGRINESSGSFTIGADSVAIDATAKADSVDTGNKKRDEHVKNNDFFGAKEFPTMTFKADKLTRSGDGFSGQGQLTFRGVTKPIDITGTISGSAAGRDGKKLAGIEVKASFKRSDFGNSTMVGPLSDEVNLIVSFEGGAK